MREKIKDLEDGDVPGGPVVKNLLFNTGVVGWIPGQGTKIPHAKGQLAHVLQLRACALEPTHHSREKPACHNPMHGWWLQP